MLRRPAHRRGPEVLDGLGNEEPGCDEHGNAQPAPAANGPDMKVILRHPTLLPRSMEIMMQVWDLVEAAPDKQWTEPKPH